MYKVTAICDKCKKEETIESEYEYFSNFKSVNNYDSITLKISQYQEKKYLLCEDCRKSLGLISEVKKEVKVETVGDRLLELISEIVRENLEV